MIRRPPRSTPLYSSAASDVYKRQVCIVIVTIVIPSTSGEGSAIFQGASRSRRCRLQFCEIKISLRLLHIEGRGLLDLVEICLFSPSKRCAFDFRHPTFAHPRANHTPGAPALRTWILATFGNCGGLSGRVLGNSQNSPPTLRREFRKPRQRPASPRGGFSPRGLYF